MYVNPLEATFSPKPPEADVSNGNFLKHVHRLENELVGRTSMNFPYRCQLGNGMIYNTDQHPKGKVYAPGVFIHMLMEPFTPLDTITQSLRPMKMIKI